MQNYLLKASIYGLWGLDEEIHIPLDKKFNFLIGRNGTGKTTVINLIAAALTADFERLDKTQFSRIVIGLQALNGRKKPSIEVVKQAKRDLPYENIEYKIRLSASEEPTIFDLDLVSEERAFRGIPPRFIRDRSYRQKFVYIQSQLESMVRVNWLSVHRASPYERIPEEMRHATAIDQKLTDLNNSLVRYYTFIMSIDLEEEKRSLASIFELLGVAPKHYSRQVDQVAEDFESARELFLSNSPMHLHQLFAIATSFRTHSIVQLYEKLQEERKMIYRPVNKFIEVVNGLLAPRKRVSISSQNELVVMGTDNDRRIEIEALSSGEKQLLIILGQALLQESTPVIFIADEPELSLHVEWQEKLTPSIAELNPNAQIVFATHSPDIVGAYTHRLIDMENVASK